ncbi:hypothetical protein [Spiroplasma clarkii]|uniref:Uncharacterized protein n=1 Tax=Spiroplasma clarkii TaxID=2139 RepID=A0A2K8KHB6_9MOLU|nr:hypothetical protein [Spiroplasma clarkii]ATX71078.1 hypothetical protein SCLAR_v1c07630 [Spiroplasma clarkii]
MTIALTSILAGIGFALPFIVWAVFRFLDKIKQISFTWSKWVILAAFVLFWAIAILLIVLYVVL